jgi:glycosyltransferase involved in cell wall biosynthesis
MNRPVLFSLLIANYNNGKFFKDCYESIVAQTYDTWEAIIVDDGSTDDSWEIIKNIIGNDKRFKFYVNDKNYGRGYTKRKCVELANGDICGFLDPDDALLSKALEKMHTGYLNNPDAVLIHSSLIYCSETLEKQNVYSYASAIQESGSWFLNLDHCVTHFVTFKRSEYIKTEGIDAYLPIAEDQDLFLKMYETGPFQFLNEPLYLYRRHPQNISGNGNLERGQFWHWFVIMQAAKRRNITVDHLFSQFFINRKKYEKLERKMNKNVIIKLYNLLSSLFGALRINKRATTTSL